MAAIGTWAVVVLAVVVICCAQFIGNIQLVQADYDYHNAQGYEQAANNVANQASQIATAEATYLAAIADYQDALNTLPSWNGTPKYDDYYLFLGRAWLEYADTLDTDLQNNITKTVTPGQVTQAFQSAANVFVDAAKANPLDPDHPRNLGKLYLEWSGVNLVKPYTPGKPDLQNAGIRQRLLPEGRVTGTKQCRHSR